MSVHAVEGRRRRADGHGMRTGARATLAVSLALLTLAWIGVPARAASGGITFFGSGDGHGLGMSQWGAYGLAKQGWTYERILTHFYSGTRVGRLAAPVRSVRVELTYDRTTIHVKALTHPLKLTVGTAEGPSVGQVPTGVTWTVNAAADGYRVRDAHGVLVGGHAWGGPKKDLIGSYMAVGGRVFVPEADAIWHRGFTYDAGHLEFNLYGCPSACRERLVLPVAFERYLQGIGEVPSSWPPAALRAQAVAARTYATYEVKHYGLRAGCNCNLTDGANDQTYVGADKVAGPDGARWANAVTTTAGRVVTYRGAVTQTFFAASDGGHTENIEDAWFGGNKAYAVPYLRGVCDPGEYTAANPWTNWKYSFTLASLTSRLAPYTGGIGTVSGFPTVVHAPGGQIMSAKVEGSTGTAAVTGTELRAALGLPEDRAWIGINKNILGAVRAKYDGLMCAPGLPTTRDGALPGGSRQRFAKGGIYRNDHANVTVWMTGPTDAEYIAVGGAGGVLGLPTSTIGGVGAMRADTVGCPCSRVSFVGGRIYFKTGLGAFALWGPVLNAYLDRNGATGPLGFPTSRIQHDGAGAAFATFEHGRITCPAGAACTSG